MIWRRRVFEKSAIDVLANLLRLQKFGTDFDPHNLFRPIEFVLLDLIKAVHFFVNWRPQRRRRDLFFGRRIIEVAMDYLFAGTGKYRQLGMTDGLSLSLRIQHQPILL